MSSFDSEKQTKVLMQFFMEIEEILREKQYFDEAIYSRIDILIDNMSNTYLHDKVASITFTKREGWEYAYDVLNHFYDYLRHVFYEDLLVQKDFHIFPKIKVSNQDIEKRQKMLPVILILDNLRSAFNVGSIIRTAECVNISEIWFCGYTPRPDHSKIKTTSMGTQQRIRWQHFSQTKDAVIKAFEIGYSVYAIETVENGTSLFDSKLHGKIAFVFGNEALGISEDVLLMCDKCLILPIYGWKNSLNVATTCAVVCFEFLRQNSLL